jgi:hypothetical protein
MATGRHLPRSKTKSFKSVFRVDSGWTWSFKWDKVREFSPDMKVGNKLTALDVFCLLQENGKELLGPSHQIFFKFKYGEQEVEPTVKCSITRMDEFKNGIIGPAGETTRELAPAEWICICVGTVAAIAAIVAIGVVIYLPRRE